MGGFFHLADLKQGKMARKFGTQKKNVGGLEAPRNSLELSVETCQSYYPPQDGLHQHDWSETGCYPAEAPMKKLINDEMSKRAKSRANAPSIVARLMGVETLPLDTKPVTRAEEKNEIPANDLSKEKLTRSSSVGSGISPSKSFRHTRLDSFHLDEDSDPDEWSGSTASKKPMPREHPQEEELQKFKKEFEAWQSARFKECSKIVEHGSTPPAQWMAQENLNNEKMALYSNSGTKGQKLQDLKKSRSLKAGLHDRSSSYEFPSPDEKRSFPIRRKTLSEDFESSPLRPDQETGTYSTPTRIVILRPGFDNIGYPEEPWAASSSGASEDRNNIEDFLEEVKERLKFELQGKTFKRGGVEVEIETPYSERPSDPKQIAQRIAKQVRESVTKDLGTNLLRSESTRSYRGESQCSGTSSPEFISRDTRRLLSERLRNVLKRESYSNTSMDVENTPKSSILNRKLHSSDILKDENDIHSKSFRCGPDDMNMILQRDLSPINLVRSLSAPVSGTSFGKLLLEDRHVVTGAQIRRKHEANEKLTMKVKKQRKDKFNLKERVSSFKYSLSLRARLFARKIHSATEFRDNDRSFVKDIMNGPTVMMNFAERPENATEVPPSPASVCSSIHEDFYRAAYCVSPSTTPGAVTSDDNDLPQAFRDISSNLNELRKQLQQLETGRSEETVIEEQPMIESDMVELEDEDEAYVRDLLIASGLYDNSFDKSLTRFDTFAKPISNRVFEQVEESQKNIIEPKEHADQKKAHHKVLLDLLNEILSTVLAPPIHVSKFGRKAARPPRGNTLLDQVWGMLREYLHPPIDKSFYFFDTMVARDLRSMPWSELVNEDINAQAKELECQIVRDLVEETVKEMRDDRGDRNL
ncbi:LOW QUALITY PROTEIN: hypothetical protein OSB04_000631 [Centaurea solstitialis]|uniref:DUF4378 domain-containing protein n=1 Tax=Centaurea solstitialis TaxID=347529 RepID=A0AA38WS74_9ASTR|nr:LOW QUALITY PROTEIN: hypothetical protein OSB04_000631 [Centaurea solstitialis]